MPPITDRPRSLPGLIALTTALLGVVAALLLPVAPVEVDRSTLTWPTAQPAPTTALLVPYRPDTLTVTLPCAALGSARAAAGPTTVFSTGPGDGTLRVLGGGGAVTLVAGAGVRLPIALPTDPAPDCRAEVSAGRDGLTLRSPDGRSRTAAVPVPEVFAFLTDLDDAALEAAAAEGLSATVTTVSVFATSPTPGKKVLVAVALLAAAASLVALVRASPRHAPRVRRRRRPALLAVDAAVVALFAGWAVVGPLAVDDGWATTIARTITDTGGPGNVYRWWNASETPFAGMQRLLSPFAEVSIAPLWLRVPSTIAAIATWFVLTRGVLPAALPGRARRPAVRATAAVALALAWLPFDLGTRPESVVALASTCALALAWRARTLAALGALAAVVAVAATISPTAVTTLAPVVVFAPRLRRVLRDAVPRGRPRAAVLACLASVLSLALVAVFADESADAVLEATRWHTFFGPTLPLWEESARYAFLFGGDQQGSAFKRLPVLLAAASLPVAAALAWRSPHRRLAGAAARAASVVALAAALLALSPSKWSFHLGGLAGLIAAALTVVAALGVHTARRHRIGAARAAVVAACALAPAVAAAAAFAGPNAWWLPVLYDVPWPAGPIRPLGVPLDAPALWLAVAGAVAVALWLRGGVRGLAATPAVVTALSAVTAVALLVGSFVGAPLRRPAASLAAMNLERLAGGAQCGFAEAVEVLPDGPPLAAAAGSSDALAGVVAAGGWPDGAAPPEPAGQGASTYVWGSVTEGGTAATGTLVSRWFVLPPLPADGGLAVSVAGRTDGGNALEFEFGRSTDGSTVETLGAVTPPDRPASDENPARPLWRTVGVDPAAVPPGADRVRVRGVDARADASGWFGVTGPRLRTRERLDRWLAARGPVLVAWQMAFLFPCVRDVPRVAGGVAQTPATIVEPPRPRTQEDRDRIIGGTFHGVRLLGRQLEVPTQVIGHPELDWGAVLVYDPGVERDAYGLAVEQVERPGRGGVPTVTPER